MLAQTLHALERDGLVTRDVQATIPPRVEYTLTTPGARIAATVRAERSARSFGPRWVQGADGRRRWRGLHWENAAEPEP
jgi:DNA-binding HxlR family transcriptional regulator